MLYEGMRRDANCEKEHPNSLHHYDFPVIISSEHHSASKLLGTNYTDHGSGLIWLSDFPIFNYFSFFFLRRHTQQYGTKSFPQLKSGRKTNTTLATFVTRIVHGGRGEGEGDWVVGG